jgi:hypothetical protein
MGRTKKGVRAMLRPWRPVGVGSRRVRLVGVVLSLFGFAFVVTGCDKLTGGGWIQSRTGIPGQKATFGFNAKCKNTTMDGMPVAVFYEGQFEYDDHAFSPLVRVHGDVEPFEFASAVGQTCQEVAAEPGLPFSEFGGTYRTQPQVTPTLSGEFAVFAADGGEPGSINGDELTVTLSGGIVYFNTGIVQGGNIQVQ